MDRDSTIIFVIVFLIVNVLLIHVSALTIYSGVEFEVDKVKLNIIYSYSSISNLTMNHLTGTNTYYYNTSFSQHGSYSYYVWAWDTSANGNTSDSNVFSLPPSWDIDSDGQCNVVDPILISNHYTKLGDPGWMREDVDNSGAIKVVDLVFISNHYGENW